MTLLEKMDRLVYATGIDRILFMKFTPRSLRWTPLLVLAGLVAGYAIVVSSHSGISGLRRMITGALLFFGAYLAAYFVRIFGPRMAPIALHPLDERELMVRARASAISGTILATGAMIGCFYLAIPDLFGWWRPHQSIDWLYLGFGLQGTAVMLPTMIASWLQPRPTADIDDED